MNASNTSSRGASMTGEITISGSAVADCAGAPRPVALIGMRQADSPAAGAQGFGRTDRRAGTPQNSQAAIASSTSVATSITITRVAAAEISPPVAANST